MTTEIPVLEPILGANDAIAAEVRAFLNQRGILALDVLGAPGAGKTSVILGTVRALGGRVRAAVIEGDVASTVDARRVAAEGLPVVQINTGGGCHLDAPTVQGALQRLDLAGINLLFIENVGNLICPNAFSVGAQRRVVVASVPEGDDKPYKYPDMFRDSDVVLLNKVDLLPYVEFDLPAYRTLVRALNPDVAYFELCARSGEGLAAWADWLLTALAAART
jgi:hydrogenase nickel incorporation protein HypB